MSTTHHRPAPHRARSLAAGLAATLVLIAAACGGGDDEAAPTTTVADTEPATTEVVETTVPETTEAPTTPPTTPPTTVAATTTTEAVIVRMPLTGIPLEFGQTVPDRPALVVKIDNNANARPQSGLNEADIVFEEVVEFGTRFAAVFHSGNANPVGPIRSGRTQDIDLLSGLHQPLFAWSGGNAGVTRVIAESDFIDLNPNQYSGLYRRQGNNGTPHNYYSSTDELFAQFTPEDVGRPTPLFSYLRPGEVPVGDPGGRAEFAMDANQVLWEFDPATNLYLRSTDGRAHNDELSDRRVDTTNVVIMETPYRPSFVDARSPEGVTIGGGTAWVLSGGVVRQGFWLRDKAEDGIGLFDANGAAIPLQAGRTWVELMDPVDGVPAIS